MFSFLCGSTYRVYRCHIAELQKMVVEVLAASQRAPPSRTAWKGHALGGPGALVVSLVALTGNTFGLYTYRKTSKQPGDDTNKCSAECTFVQTDIHNEYRYIFTDRASTLQSTLSETTTSAFTSWSELVEQFSRADPIETNKSRASSDTMRRNLLLLACYRHPEAFSIIRLVGPALRKRLVYMNESIKYKKQTKNIYT